MPVILAPGLSGDHANCHLDNPAWIGLPFHINQPLRGSSVQDVLHQLKHTWFRSWSQSLAFRAFGAALSMCR